MEVACPQEQLQKMNIQKFIARNNTKAVTIKGCSYNNSLSIISCNIYETDYITKVNCALNQYEHSMVQLKYEQGNNTFKKCMKC